jgi:hypothetical protein
VRVSPAHRLAPPGGLAADGGASFILAHQPRHTKTELEAFCGDPAALALTTPWPVGTCDLPGLADAK